MKHHVEAPVKVGFIKSILASPNLVRNVAIILCIVSTVAAYMFYRKLQAKNKQLVDAEAATAVAATATAAPVPAIFQTVPFATVTKVAEVSEVADVEAAPAVAAPAPAPIAPATVDDEVPSQIVEEVLEELEASAPSARDNILHSELKRKTVEELRILCKQNRVQVRGTKSELVERLYQKFKNDDDGTK
jgi:hypothetical protein